MKNAPKVSIGIAVFNGENFLESALRSILAQTFEDFELIISDNASTDRTADICEQYASQDGRVLYLRQPANLGAQPNYNLLVGQARGRYFKWAAHDDMLAPTFLERCVEFRCFGQLSLRRDESESPQPSCDARQPVYDGVAHHGIRPFRATAERYFADIARDRAAADPCSCRHLRQFRGCEAD